MPLRQVILHLLRGYAEGEISTDPDDDEDVGEAIEPEN